MVLTDTNTRVTIIYPNLVSWYTTEDSARTFVLEEYSSALLRIVGSTEQKKNKIGGYIGDIEFGSGVAVDTKKCSRTRGIVETFYTTVSRHCVGKAVGV